MADVRATGRGQLHLVSAVGLALLLVSLTVVLNTAVFAENLATRGGLDDARAAQFRDAAVGESAAILTYVNRNNDTSYDALEANYTAFVEEWGNLTGRHAAAEGRARYVSVRGVTNGTRVVQTNASREFTNASGTSNWTLVSDATGTRDYRMNVSRDGLVDADANDDNVSQLVGADAFAAAVDTGSDQWRVFVYQDGSDDVLVNVGKNGVLQGSCQLLAGADGYVVVDLSNASLDDQSCAPLDPVAGALDGDDGLVDVSYERSDSAVGTYHFVVDRRRSVVDDDDFAPTGSPTTGYALYAADVELGYVTADLRVNETVRIVPGETDV